MSAEPKSPFPRPLDAPLSNSLTGMPCKTPTEGQDANGSGPGPSLEKCMGQTISQDELLGLDFLLEVKR